MAGLIFDAGALIAGERDDRRVHVALKSALKKEVPVLVPSLLSQRRAILAL